MNICQLEILNGQKQYVRDCFVYGAKYFRLCLGISALPSQLVQLKGEMQIVD